MVFEDSANRQPRPQFRHTHNSVYLVGFFAVACIFYDSTQVRRVFITEVDNRVCVHQHNIIVHALYFKSLHVSDNLCYSTARMKLPARTVALLGAVVRHSDAVASATSRCRLPIPWGSRSRIMDQPLACVLCAPEVRKNAPKLQTEGAFPGQRATSCLCRSQSGGLETVSEPGGQSIIRARGKQIPQTPRDGVLPLQLLHEKPEASQLHCIQEQAEASRCI